MLLKHPCGKGLGNPAEAHLPAFQDQDQAVGQGEEHGSLPARKDALIEMIAGRSGVPEKSWMDPYSCPTGQCLSDPPRASRVLDPELPEPSGDVQRPETLRNRV